MSLPDTAEYWQDVKNRNLYMGRHFIHIENNVCGHISKVTGNTDTSNYLNDINCFACLKLLKENGNIYSLNEGISKREQKEIDKENRRYRFGKCECGSPFRERVNSKTSEKFLGCANYPKCKITKKI